MCRLRDMREWGVRTDVTKRGSHGMLWAHAYTCRTVCRALGPDLLSGAVLFDSSLALATRKHMTSYVCRYIRGINALRLVSWGIKLSLIFRDNTDIHYGNLSELEKEHSWKLNCKNSSFWTAEHLHINANLCRPVTVSRYFNVVKCVKALSFLVR